MVHPPLMAPLSGGGDYEVYGERVDYATIIYTFPGLSLVSSGAP